MAKDKCDVVVFIDPNKDPDDLVTFVMLSGLVQEEKVNIKAVVTTLGDEDVRKKRAQMAKGVFDRLGVNAKVAYGNNYEYESPKRQADDQTFLNTDVVDVSILMAAENKVLPNAQALLYKTCMQSEDNSLSFVVIAGMSDLAVFMKTNPDLIKRKARQIVVMGGVENALDNNGNFVPDKRAYNNTTNYEGAKTVYENAQKQGIKLVVVSKEDAYKVPVSKMFYEVLNKEKSPIGKYLQETQKTSINALWENIQNKTIPALTNEWFFKTFTSLDANNDKSKIVELEKSGDFNNIWKEVTKLNLYDPLTMLTALDNPEFGVHQRRVGQEKEVYFANITDENKVKRNLLSLCQKALNPSRGKEFGKEVKSR